jgi:DNA (cytosine-5)-methyltransferase 1
VVTEAKSLKTNHTVVELFSGCGGMALGFENAGFNTKLLVEIDKDSVDTLRANRPKWNILHEDIKKIDFTSYKNKIDVVAGGFPCQAFSYAGKKLGLDDTRGTLFFEFARAVKEINPKIAVAENVRGLTTHDGGNTLRIMLGVMEDLGYDITYKVLKAQLHQVPQKRERLFMICTRKDLSLTAIFPEERTDIYTLRDALKDCPASGGYEYKGDKLEVMKQVPEGGNWRNLSVEMQKKYMKKSYYLGGGKTGIARRLSFDEPALTIVTSPVMRQTERGHPVEDRPINLRESARIQTFPDSWAFSGTKSSVYKQIGNAVPVNLAYHVGKCIINTLEGQER